MDDYIYKFNSFVTSQIKDIKDLKIIEFGVKEGRSTGIFLDLCKKNGGHLYSIDIDDYNKKFCDSNWTFIQTRDDNFDLLETRLPREVDIIYLDSLHEADHVQKIFYHYYKKLKRNGLFFIDDISWLPYLKNQKRDSFYCELNNKETFEKILEIYNINSENFDLTFNFKSSGMCKIKKKTDEELISPKKIVTRVFSLKNIIRRILKFLK